MTLMQIIGREYGLPAAGSVIELGAQDISANHIDMAKHIKRFSGSYKDIDSIKTSADFYSALGFKRYNAIDASGENGAYVFDLNTNIEEKYSFFEKFDVVTNLGTIEHCFNVSEAFKNMHNLCKAGGLMVHAFPSSGNANHGLYNLQPRLFALLAQSNNYEILNFSFTVDYKPELRKFTHDHYASYDDRDLMCYVVYKKNDEKPFVFPFDSMFDDINKLDGYKAHLDANEFRPYIKGSWNNIKPSSLEKVPLKTIQRPAYFKTILKHVFDIISRML